MGTHARKCGKNATEAAMHEKAQVQYFEVKGTSRRYLKKINTVSFKMLKV